MEQAIDGMWIQWKQRNVTEKCNHIKGTYGMVHLCKEKRILLFDYLTTWLIDDLLPVLLHMSMNTVTSL